MKTLFRKILKEIDVKWMMDNTEKLWKKELGQCFKDYHAACQFTESLLKESGLDNVEIINFPADGKTAYQDKIMPMAWDATYARLTIKKSPIPFTNPVIADFQKHPFHLIKGSTSTKAEGINVRLISENQLFNGEDGKGCLIVTNPSTSPRPEILKAVLDLGAIGLISDWIKGRYDTPDGIQWVTACTEGPHWHIHQDDRPFIGFSVSPRVGDQLRAAVSSGEVIAHVVCDGKRYEGKLPAVTATLPGKEDKELWILSHLYEPLADDNSSGVIASIEIARTIKKLISAGELPPLRFTLRLVFAMEMYGFAAFADRMGGYLHNKVLGGINTDGMAVVKGASPTVWLSPPGTGFFGDYLMEELFENYRGMSNPKICELKDEGAYFDDMFLSDSTTGIPTLWVLGPGNLWHNSEQTMSIIDPDYFTRATAFIATWVTTLLTASKDKANGIISRAALYAKTHLHTEAGHIFDTLTKTNEAKIERTIGTQDIDDWMNWRLKREEGRLLDFKQIFPAGQIDKELDMLRQEKQRVLKELKERITDIHSHSKVPCSADKWLEYADTIISKRITIGLPYDLSLIPKEQRRPIPGNVIYGPFARILANMDGKKTLKYLLKQAEWESKTCFNSKEIKKYIHSIEYLTEFGYLKTTFKGSIRKNNIISALKQAGISKGELLLVHSGLSHFGYIKGGADTIIDAFLEVIGENGTLLLPTFTRPFVYFDGCCIKGNRYRPHDKDNESLVCVGKIPQIFLKRHGVIRSKNATHSVAGIGPLASKCLSEHKEADPPVCRRSPFGKLLDYNGKMVWFGADLASTTFFHFLEDEMNMPYLGNAVCRIEDPDGTLKTVFIPKHLPGHRDFYNTPAEETKLYKRLLSDGLKIKKSILGLGTVKVIDAKQMYSLGIKAIKNDPDILLCDSKECLFCSKYRQKTRR